MCNATTSDILVKPMPDVNRYVNIDAKETGLGIMFIWRNY